MWIIYAFLSAITAAFVTIFSKMGLKNVDPTAATSIRAVIMAVFVLVVAIISKKINGTFISSLGSKDWTLITLAGISGALSWIFYFIALKDGSASKVASIDRLSIVFIVLLSYVLLGDAFNIKSLAGAILISFGAFLIVR